MSTPPVSERLRLDRFLSHSAGLSRTEAKKLLHAGFVSVDGTPIRNPAHAVTLASVVTLHGTVLEAPRQRYLMLYKPPGYVCSSTDATHLPVHSLIPHTWATDLHAAGRLDADTTGLVLLTNDGAWSHALTNPRRHCFKTYLVTAKHPLAADLPDRFAAGVLLNDDPAPTLPAHLELLDSHTARVRLREGRYHQVKRMFAACGNRVDALHRESIGSLVLDPALEAGQWRELTVAEIRMAADD